MRLWIVTGVESYPKKGKNEKGNEMERSVSRNHDESPREKWPETVPAKEPDK